MKRLKMIWPLLCLLAVLLLGGCGSSAETEATEEPEATEEAAEEAEATATPEPDLSTIETVEKAIREEDRKTLYDTLRYWDAAQGTTGKYSMDMIDAFLEYLGGDEALITEFLDIVVDEFYDESQDVLSLPAVYIVITTDTDYTYFSFPVFGEKSITRADYKGLKLGPMLPMSYTIVASNESWSEETQTRTLQVSLQELTVSEYSGTSSSEVSSAKHTYYVRFEDESPYDSSSSTESSDDEDEDSDSDSESDSETESDADKDAESE